MPARLVRLHDRSSARAGHAALAARGCRQMSLDDGDPLCPTGAVVLRGRYGELNRNGPQSSWRMGLCTWCGKTVPKGRRTLWCSRACVDAYSVTLPDGQRSVLWSRDHGVCSLCQLDTERLLAMCMRWLSVWGVNRRARPRRTWAGLCFPRRLNAEQDLARCLEARGMPTTPRVMTHLVRDRRCWWDVDHRVPIADGGHPCDPGNLRTLCYWCHKRETASAATRRASRRRAGKGR